MLHSSVYWIALAVSVVAFWVIPARFRLFFLATVGPIVIAYFDVVSVCFLLVMAVGTFVALPYIARPSPFNGWLTVFVIAALVGPLIAFKSGTLSALLSVQPDVPASDVIVPLGMSYYAFRLVHVVVEAYRAQQAPFSARDYFSYIFLFTIVPAGPIQRLDLFLAGKAEAFDWDHILHGLFRICVGLIKQVLLLDYILQFRSSLAGTPILSTQVLAEASYGTLWVLLATAYVGSLLNLSAYTDLAIGASRLFGFKISENFNYPLMALSIPDYWRRWHITLSNWCQTYVYSPVLGWSRNPYIGLIVSFQVMGLWHAFSVNRMLWGLFHASGVAVASLFRKFCRQRKIAWVDTPYAIIPSWILTQAFVCASMIFVVAERDADYMAALRVLLRLIFPPMGMS
jgi:alginate O-acetyltransferase complex protein AlgI